VVQYKNAKCIVAALLELNGQWDMFERCVVL